MKHHDYEQIDVLEIYKPYKKPVILFPRKQKSMKLFCLQLQLEDRFICGG